MASKTPGMHLACFRAHAAAAGAVVDDYSLVETGGDDKRERDPGATIVPVVPRVVDAAHVGVIPAYSSHSQRGLRLRCPGCFMPATTSMQVVYTTE